MSTENERILEGLKVLLEFLEKKQAAGSIFENLFGTTVRTPGMAKDSWVVKLEEAHTLLERNQKNLAFEYSQMKTQLESLWDVHNKLHNQVQALVTHVTEADDKTVAYLGRELGKQEQKIEACSNSILDSNNRIAVIQENLEEEIETHMTQDVIDSCVREWLSNNTDILNDEVVERVDRYLSNERNIKEQVRDAFENEVGDLVENLFEQEKSSDFSMSAKKAVNLALEAAINNPQHAIRAYIQKMFEDKWRTWVREMLTKEIGFLGEKEA